MNHLAKVCIVGAGPMGLMTARHLTETESNEVIIFESKDNIGGLWGFDDRNEADLHFETHKGEDSYYQLYKCFHSSMYPSLKSNTPYFLSGFKDLSHIDVVPEISAFFNIKQ